MTLNQDQQKSFEKGMSLYVNYFMDDNNNTPEMLDVLYNAFEILDEHVDEVDDIRYRMLFALAVQSMQDSQEFELSDDCIKTKNNIYLEILKWSVNLDFISAINQTEVFKIFLCIALDNLAQILLKGDELPQNDHIAWMCYRECKKLGHLMLENVFDRFEKNKDGLMALKAGVARPT